MTDASSPRPAAAAPPPVEIPFVDLRAMHAPIQGEMDEAIRRVFDRCVFIGGEECRRFEEELAASVGAPHAVGAASCTAALSMALLACGVGPGDEVIAPTHTYIATVEAIAFIGARPVLVDIGPADHLMDPAAAEAAITPRTRALIAVHLYGAPCDMDRLGALAARHHLALIEDCAQSQGTLYRGRATGTLGLAAAFSFFPSKNLGAAGDAGALITSDPEIARKARMIANHGRLEKFTHEIPGYNFRLDTLQAAILRVKLRHLGAWNAARRAARRLYNELLRGAEGVGLPAEPEGADIAPHLYAVQVERREALRAALRARGVETGVHYPAPVHLHPAFASPQWKPGAFPRAEAYCARTLSLPMHGAISEEHVRRVCGILREALAAAPRP